MIRIFSNNLNFFKKLFILALGPLFFVGICDYNPAWSQTGYPNRPIKIVIPYEPGSIGDLATRVIQHYLTRELKVTVVIENRGGGGGMIGTNMVAHRTAPDGYTVLQAGDGPMIISPLRSSKPTYDPDKDLLPLCSYGGSPLALVVVSSSSIKTLDDFVKEAKEKPGKLSVGVTQFGGDGHLSYEMFRRAAGLNTKIVPNKGTGEAAAALLGNHIDALFGTYVAITPFLKSGEARLLAITDKRPGSSELTLVEAGYTQEPMTMTNGFFVHSKTPKPIYERLVSAFKLVLTNPELTKKLGPIGLTPAYKSPAEYINYLKVKREKYARLINELGLKEK